MGTIMSPVPEIDRINWVRYTGKLMKAKAVVIISQDGQHDLMVAALESGAFACSRDISKYAYMPGDWPWMDSVIKALVKLGAITQAAADKHMQCCADAKERRDRRYRADALRRLASETGIPLSEEQVAFVNEAEAV